MTGTGCRTAPVPLYMSWPGTPPHIRSLAQVPPGHCDPPSPDSGPEYLLITHPGPHVGRGIMAGTEQILSGTNTKRMRPDGVGFAGFPLSRNGPGKE